MARTFLPVWEDESTRPALVAVYRTGMSDGPIARTLRDRVQAALASCLGRIAPEETERSPMFTSSVSAQLTGLVMLRYVFPAEPLASLDVEELTKLFALAVDVPRVPQQGVSARHERGTSYSRQ
ncbi:hypothetical protein ACFYYN_12660 [Streptomyces sp. NPDC001902]